MRLRGGGREGRQGDQGHCSRVDAGTHPLRHDTVDLAEVLDEVARATRLLASRRGVVIACTGLPTAFLTGDEDLIRRLVANLVDNAVRHAPPGTTVRLDLRQQSPGFAIAVSDAGPGIALEHQPHVFERFYRVDVSRARRQSDGGAGLGLALARWIARAHRGDVTLVESSPRGSTFVASFPADGPADS